MIVKTYHVAGMSCKGCAASVEATLKAQSGVSRATVDLPAKLVSVGFHGAPVSFESLQKAIRAIGYDLSENQTREQTI